MPELILASASPRRQELLALTGLPFSIKAPQIEETIAKDLPLPQALEKLSLEKAAAIHCQHPQAVVIGADTVVVIPPWEAASSGTKEVKILGKPRNQAEAESMLELLSGQKHQVITAVSLLSRHKRVSFHARALVQFYPLSPALIRNYVESGESLDKAGAYGIQGRGALLISEIIGDYYTIMGLPLGQLYRELPAFGFDLPI